jgi:hypothetical protein
MSVKKLSPIDELFEDREKRIGRIVTSEEHRAKGPGFANSTLNRDVTQDGIRIFVDGEGDLNPLFRDPEYAKNTKYKCLIAPPNYLYTICYAQRPPEFGRMIPGIAGFYSGCEREWFRPICVGDKFTYRIMCPAENRMKKSKFAERTVQSFEKVDYYRQGGELIAGYSSYETWADEEKIKERNKYGNMDKMPEYTEKDLEEIYAAQDREEIRGANPRWWEDVSVGDELTPVVRGPISDIEAKAWHAGGHAHYLSDRLNRILWKEEPLEREFLTTNGVGLAHPRPALAGQQPEAWRFIILTNWMGDDGFIWKLNAQIRKFTMHGDTTWIKGKVIKKYCDNKKCCVDIDIQNVLQTGDVAIIGSATIILPSKEFGPVVYPEPCNRVPYAHVGA